MTNGQATDANPKHAGGIDRWQYAVEWAIAIINTIAFFVGLALCVGLDGELRIWAAVFLVLFGPGSGLVQLVGAFDTTVRIVLVVGLSVASSTLVAQVLLAIGSFGLLQAAIPLTVITALGFTLRLISFASRVEVDEESA